MTSQQPDSIRSSGQSYSTAPAFNRDVLLTEGHVLHSSIVA